MQANFSASIEFLRAFHGDAPWVLTAIKDRAVTTRTFHEEGACRLWLEEKGADHNIYFQVNPVRGDVEKKTAREDIAAMAWLHIDLDPRAGEDLEEEQKRILDSLLHPPGDVPPPTCIIFSGGGYQGFWKLSTPIPIDGDVARAEDAKRYNTQLETLFSSDATGNVDRIMRLPGTVNRPDAKKKAKGRRPALAKVVDFCVDRTYDIRRFTKAPPTQAADVGFAGRKVAAPGNVRRVDVMEELGEKLPRWVGPTIVHGKDPEGEKTWPSRSEALFAVVCALVRADVSDEDIYSIITDQDHRISESVLEKGSSMERYALRQIERAREECEDKNLREMNDRHAVVRNYGGKCRVLEEQRDDRLERSLLTVQSFGDIEGSYCNVEVTIGNKDNGTPITMPLGKWWLKHPHRRQYDRVTFVPGRDVEGAYNLWRGFACDARPGNCDLYLEHVRETICAGNVEKSNYLLKWMANCVQNPAQPGEVAVVLRGRQGTGKGVFAKTFGALWGRHFMQIANSKFLVGAFNAHLRDCVVLFADEAFHAGDKIAEGVLKTLITEHMLVIEAKGINAETSANCVHLIMASNEQWVAPVGTDDRRFFVLDVTDRRIKDFGFFEALERQMLNGGREALLHFLMNLDLEGWNIRQVPETWEHAVQVDFSRPPEEAWWYQKLRDARVLPEHDKWEREVPAIALFEDFKAETGEGSQLSFGHLFRRLVPRHERIQKRTPCTFTRPNGSVATCPRPYFYVLPTLEECRDWFDKAFSGPRNWETVREDDTAPPPEEF